MGSSPLPVSDLVVAKVLAATRTALRGSALGGQMVAQGATMGGMDPAAFDTLLISEKESWGQLIRSIGLKLE